MTVPALLFQNSGSARLVFAHAQPASIELLLSPSGGVEETQGLLCTTSSATAWDGTDRWAISLARKLDGGWRLAGARADFAGIYEADSAAGLSPVGVPTRVRVEHEPGVALRLYLDGVLQLSVPTPTPLFATTHFWIGRAPRSVGLSIGGWLSDIRVWSTPRGAGPSGDEFMRLLGDEPGLAIYARVDEGAGTHLEDSSGGLDADGVINITSNYSWTTVADPFWAAPEVTQLLAEPDAPAPGTLRLTASASDPEGAADALEYRFRVHESAADLDVHDSGWQASNVAEIPGLARGELLLCYVTVRDSHGLESAEHGSTPAFLDAPPTAAFTAQLGGRTASCASQASDPEGGVLLIEYDFGEGDGYQAEAVHEYSAGGSFTLTQRVTDQMGYQDSASLQLEVPAIIACGARPESALSACGARPASPLSAC